MNKADLLLSYGAMRQVELQRVATWMLDDLLTDLNEMMERVASIAKSAEIDRVTRPAARRREEARLLQEIEEAIADVIAEIRKRLETEFDSIAEITTEREKRSFLFVYGLGLVGSPSVNHGSPLVDGFSVGEQIEQLESDLNRSVAGHVKQSIFNNETSDDLYWRVLGKSESVDFPGEVKPVTRTMEAMVRTGVAAIPTAVQLELTPRANVIAKHGWQHISVLDSRTSDTCRNRAWKKWDSDFNPVGHKLPFRQPPLHPNCRSRIQLIFLDDPDPQTVSFTAWVNALPDKTRIELFGELNFRRWRVGKLTDADLIRQRTRPLTTNELRKMTEDSDEKQFPLL